MSGNYEDAYAALEPELLGESGGLAENDFPYLGGPKRPIFVCPLGGKGNGLAHSFYVSKEEARKLAAELVAAADETDEIERVGYWEWRGQQMRPE